MTDEKIKGLQDLFDKIRRLPDGGKTAEIWMKNTPEIRAKLKPEVRAALESEMADMAAVPVRLVDNLEDGDRAIKVAHALGATHLILVHGNEDGRKNAFRETWERGFFDGNIPVFFSDPFPKGETLPNPFLPDDGKRYWDFGGYSFTVRRVVGSGRFRKRGRYTKRAQNERKWRAWHPFWGIWDFIEDGSMLTEMYGLTRVTEDT